MDQQNIIAFLKALGCKSIQATEGSEWVKAVCPLAPWLHRGETRIALSFGVRVPKEMDEAPSYHCYVCWSSGPLPRLVHNLQWLTGEYYGEASEILSKFALGDEDDPKTRKRIYVRDRRFGKLGFDAIKRSEPLSPEVIDQYPLVAETDNQSAKEIIHWLTQRRKISEHLVQQYKLRLYTAPNTGKAGVVFPIYDEKEENIMDLWVQMIGDEYIFRLPEKYPLSSMSGKGKDFWFGNQRCDPEKPLVLVEKPLAVLRLRSLGVENVWGCGDGGPTTSQLEKVKAKVVYFGFNADGKGRLSTKKGIREVRAESRIILRWHVVGIKSPEDLENTRQFRTVFNDRTKIE